MKNILFDGHIGNVANINENINIYWSGDKKLFNKIKSVINQNMQLDIKIIKNILINQTGQFSFILKYYDDIYAAVDIVCSYPLFYSINRDRVSISNSASSLRTKYGLNNVNSDALFEFYSSGYVTGDNTIYNNLFKMKPGEILSVNTKNNNYKFEQYFIYQPIVEQQKNKTTKNYLDELNALMDKIFMQVIENANGAPIWLPLSGGLDSRFIACKLKSLDYPNLFSFSYGPTGNYEAIAAQKVATVLDIPWIFMKSKSSLAKKLFQSEKRKEYWDYASGYYSLPGMMEYEALYELKRKNILPDNSIIINGQTGDFISGGHIPKSLIDEGSNVNDLIDAIITKHYSVWRYPKSNKNLYKIKSKIINILKLENRSKLSKEELASYFETWEWQARQSMFVVNGQRLYDFFGYKWMLPLWDKSLVLFYQNIPLELRLGQNLFLQYLEIFNYRNLFKNYRSEKRRWRFSILIFLKPMSVLFRLLGIDNDNIYKYFSYWSHYSNIYAFYGLRYFLKNIGKAVVPPEARGVVALGNKRWVEENINNKYELF